jgi:hypothetical protein
MAHSWWRRLHRSGFARRSRCRTALAYPMCVLVLGAGIAGCGESPTPPSEAVQNYLSALGAGNYTNACSLLDSQARQSLVTAMRVRTNCPGVFRRCLPNRPTRLKQDQTQLLYANIDVNVSGSDATATVSGTAVARELKHVALRNERTGWKVTGFGQAIERCRIIRHPGRRKAAGGRSLHGARSRSQELASLSEPVGRSAGAQQLELGPVAERVRRIGPETVAELPPALLVNASGEASGGCGTVGGRWAVGCGRWRARPASRVFPID